MFGTKYTYSIGDLLYADEPLNIILSLDLIYNLVNYELRL